MLIFGTGTWFKDILLPNGKIIAQNKAQWVRFSCTVKTLYEPVKTENKYQMNIDCACVKHLYQ